MIGWPLLAGACQLTSTNVLPAVATTAVGALGAKEVVKAPIPLGVPRPVGPS